MFAIAKREQKQPYKSAIQKKTPEKPAFATNVTGIPDTVKTKYENLSGFSFDDVRVHYNSEKPAQLQALAYTQGNQVYVGPGQERHLGHELGHVVQQKQGRVRPTIQLQSQPVNDDVTLEAEADNLEKKAGSPEKDEDDLEEVSPIQRKMPSAGTVQFQPVGVIQRWASITIQSAGGTTETGFSGETGNTRRSFQQWRRINGKFCNSVSELPINDGGKTRPRYQCAEPGALAKLLDKYNWVSKTWLRGLSFTGKSRMWGTGAPMDPCEVCSQWVTNAAAPAVRPAAIVPDSAGEVIMREGAELPPRADRNRYIAGLR